MDADEAKTRAYNAGFDAGRAGDSRESNPLGSPLEVPPAMDDNPRSICSREWSRGWDAASALPATWSRGRVSEFIEGMCEGVSGRYRRRDTPLMWVVLWTLFGPVVLLGVSGAVGGWFLFGWIGALIGWFVGTWLGRPHGK